MIELLIRILKKFGIDRAIFYTSAARIIQASTGVINVLFIAKFLSGVEQGFYYTFGSILAIQIFFELGLNGIITQYVAHEVSHLHWDSETSLSGSPTHLSRLSSLLHLGVKWYSIIAGFLFAILIIFGIVFFRRYDSSGGAVIWTFPWIILAGSTTISFLLGPILAFIEGLGKVKQVAQMRLMQQIITPLIIWISLVLGTKLYAGGISNFFGLLLLLLILLFNKYKYLIINIWKALGSERVSYKKEIFPYQWKIAISWISGYFIFQLFNPVLFATEGAVVAGQMGMTLAALNGILSLSLAWITTKVPLFSGLIAQKEYTQLDHIFNKTLKQSALINFGALAFMAGVIFLIRFLNIEINGKPFGNRFLNYIPMFFMMVPVFLNQFVAAWATYLRCHKKEPFLINSIVGGILCLLSTVLLGKYFGVIGVTSGYCLITVTMFPWAFYIFRTKRLEWHG